MLGLTGQPRSLSFGAMVEKLQGFLSTYFNTRNMYLKTLSTFDQSFREE
jgi:hypothetical protein